MLPTRISLVAGNCVLKSLLIAGLLIFFLPLPIGCKKYMLKILRIEVVIKERIEMPFLSPAGFLKHLLV